RCDPRSRRADAGGRVGRALHLAQGEPLLARAEAHPEGDDRAPDRVADDRPRALPRVPAREGLRPRGVAPLRKAMQLVVNGEARSLDVEPRTLLVHALRDELGLT